MKILTIKEMRDIASKRNGKCLSRVYKNARSDLAWQCVNGHEWQATPDNVKRGTWCPYCQNVDRISEEKCRYIFEWLTGYKFSKNRHILNSRQELDGYCAEINVAFEFNGIQHYKPIDRFRGQKSFDELQRNDKIKEDYCKSNYIPFLVISYKDYKKVDTILNEFIKCILDDLPTQ